MHEACQVKGYFPLQHAEHSGEGKEKKKIKIELLPQK